MRKAWNVTYEVITEESASEEDAAERGFELEGASFRDAMKAFGWPYSIGLVEADSCPLTRDYPPRWLTNHDHEPNYATGEYRNVSLHIPNHITPSSRMRIARLVGCYGAK